jgi:GNAT superfamily N-acetyltransferase
MRRNGDYIVWKYHQNPYISEPLIYLAFSGGQLVGMRGAMGAKWQMGEPATCFVLPYADDLVVEPAHRAQGLHRRIMEFALDDLAQRGYRYVVNLSASKVTALGSLRMSWRNAGGFGPVLRRTRSAMALNGLADRMRRWRFLWRWADDFDRLQRASNGRQFRRLHGRLATASRVRGGRSLTVASRPRSREMADLVARLPADGRIRHVRDETYFNWRFANPMRRYCFIYVSGEFLEGYLVLHQSLDFARNLVQVVDFEAEREEVGDELIEALCEFGAFPELRAWSAAMPRAAAEALYRNAFVDQSDGAFQKSILVRSLLDDELSGPWMLGGRRIDEAASWDMRMIYSMVG